MAKPIMVLLGCAAENTYVLLFRRECATAGRDERLFTAAALEHLQPSDLQINPEMLLTTTNLVTHE